MKTIYHCFMCILCVFSHIFAKAQGISGDNFVCAGTSKVYVIIDNTCAVPPIIATWSVTGGSTPSTSTIASIAWNAPSASAIRAGQINATYLCPQPIGQPDLLKNATALNVRVFTLDPPILTNSDPTQFNCGSRAMSFHQSSVFSTFVGGLHPLVTTTWSVPNCWNMIVNPNDRVFMNATTDAGGGYGTVSVKVTDASCNQSTTASKSFTRTIPALDRTFSQNPIVSDTRSGFIRANGNSSIPNLSTVVFTAGSFIELEPNFTAEYGSNFTAQIVQGPAPCVATLCSPAAFGKMDESITEPDPINKENTAISSIIKVFPNPFENNIQINYNQEEGSFELYDISGKVLTYGKLKSELNQIELTTLEKGIYFIRVIDKQGVQLHVSKVYKLN